MKYIHCMRRKENRIAVREVCLVGVFSTVTTKLYGNVQRKHREYFGICTNYFIYNLVHGKYCELSHMLFVTLPPVTLTYSRTTFDRNS
jgi:hypothetical protein